MGNTCMAAEEVENAPQRRQRIANSIPQHLRISTIVLREASRDV